MAVTKVKAYDLDSSIPVSSFTNDADYLPSNGDGSALTGVTVAAEDLTGATLPALDGSALTSLTSANLTGALPAIDGAALTSLSAGNLTGALPAIDGSALTSLTSSALTGALPALDGSALTSLTASVLTGSLPAIDGSALTSLSAGNLTGSLPAIDGSSLTGLTASVLTGALPAIDGSALTGLTSSQISGLNFVDIEIPSGTIDSSNDTFTLTAPPNPAGSLMLFKNGLVQIPTVDFTLSSSTITFAAGNIPQTGDNIIAWFRY